MFQEISIHWIREIWISPLSIEWRIYFTNVSTYFLDFILGFYAYEVSREWHSRSQTNCLNTFKNVRSDFKLSLEMLYAVAFSSFYLTVCHRKPNTQQVAVPHKLRWVLSALQYTVIINASICNGDKLSTMNTVYSDHLMGYFSAFWDSSRWLMST